MLFNFNFDFMIVLLAIVVFGVLSSYTLYIIFPTVSKKFKIALIRLSSIGTVSTQVRSSSSSSSNSTTTLVELSDSELNQLLEIVFREIGNSTDIPMSLLNSLGLYTPTVVLYLQNLGYTIIVG